MPGVPSSRGCDACRKQKKKCDQAKPACSRCTRLKIPCIGAGQRRYKFKDETTALKARAAVTTQEPSVPVKTNRLELIRMPSSGMPPVTSHLISTLQVADVRYDVCYYGEFLQDIPRRLGHNDALDAAAAALSSAYVSLHTRKRTVDVYTQYGSALKVLRRSFDDPAKAVSPDTLCAIYLVMICQGWLGLEEPVCHGEAVLHILKAASRQCWSEEFEVKMLVTLCIPVIIESIVNPKIRLDPWFWKMISDYENPNHKRHQWKERFGSEDDYAEVPRVEITSLKLCNLAKIPSYFQYPQTNILETIISHQHLLRDINTLRKRLEQGMELLGVASDVSPSPLQKIISQMQAAYGLMMATCLMLNSVLRVSDPGNITLVEASVFLSNEIMKLAEPAFRRRPLGSAYYPWALVSVWAATEEPARRLEVERLLQDYEIDLGASKWVQSAMWLKEGYEIVRKKLVKSSIVLRIQDNGERPAEVSEERTMAGMCCVQ